MKFRGFIATGSAALLAPGAAGAYAGDQGITPRHCPTVVT